VAILIGLLYYGMPTDGSSLRSRLNLCYVGLSFVVLMPYISMGLYTSDKKFYLADASAKLYRPVAYYMAKVGHTLQQGYAGCSVSNRPAAMLRGW
jgi:hypothetical protein